MLWLSSCQHMKQVTGLLLSMHLDRCTKVCRHSQVLSKKRKRQRTVYTKTLTCFCMHFGRNWLTVAEWNIFRSKVIMKTRQTVQISLLYKPNSVCHFTVDLHWCSPLSSLFTLRNNNGKRQAIFFEWNKGPVLGTLFSMSYDFLDDQTKETNDVELLSYVYAVFQNLYNGQ
jgi:hypothetical protein